MNSDKEYVKCVLLLHTWHLLDDFIDLLHENLLQEHQVVEQVCSQVVLKWADLQKNR